jgi:two-component system sensor histidine kinase CpxA
VSFLAFLTVLFVQAGPPVDRLFRGFHALQLEEAAAALQRGGVPEASAYLDRLSRRVGFTYYLTDANGHDLVTGADRSALLEPGRFGRLPRVDGRVVLSESSTDRQFRLIALVPPVASFDDAFPYFALIAAAVGLLWWLLAVGIASPIRHLTAVVDRFGRGDLESRAPVERRDEVGNLAEAFNQMAGRIQLLLTAERRLLQDISHELRSPLTRLNLGLELLRTTDQRERGIERLQGDLDRLTQLVGSLIEMTRAEGDPSCRKSDAVDVSTILQEAVESCRVEAELRDCQLAVSGNALQPVRGDRELIRRAIDNVLRNAIRYAPARTAIDIHVDEREQHAMVSIRDYGPGVPETLLPRLTDAFFRVDAARDAATGGVGLGLAIARRAVLLHHGTLVAENAHPGLRVTLTIPHEEARAGSTT